MTQINIDQVSKSFKGRLAVDELTLAVPEGSIFGLLGHNGAGKSTALGMLLGQVYPDRGTLRIRGIDVFQDRKGALNRVGAIFETPAFFDYLSGRCNLDIFTSFTGPVDERRLQRVIELVRLSERIDEPVANYSHGMRQRLALAQALLPDPQILILDEPTDGLDPEGIHEMRELVRDLNRQWGLTILFSSHLLSEVEQLCSHVAVMREGRLVHEGAWSDTPGDGRFIELETDRRDQAVQLLRGKGLLDGEAPTENWLALAADAQVAQVNRLLIEQGFAVSRIGKVRMSLEQFYLQLVKQSSADTAPSADETAQESEAS